MPKETFFRLKQEKQDRIIQELIHEFEEKTVYEATVKSIVERLHLPRGSFYQYFLSLEDAYFFILDLKFHSIHLAFLRLYQADVNNLRETLLTYGTFLAEEIYKQTNYKLFRNRYLSWSSQLESHWRAYQAKKRLTNTELKPLYTDKRLTVVGYLVHMLIQNLFIYEWEQSVFIAEYKELVKFIMEGIQYV